MKRILWSNIFNTFPVENINPLPNKPLFLRVCSKSLLKTLEKGEIAHDKQFGKGLKIAEEMSLILYHKIPSFNDTGPAWMALWCRLMTCGLSLRLS